MAIQITRKHKIIDGEIYIDSAHVKRNKEKKGYVANLEMSVEKVPNIILSLIGFNTKVENYDVSIAFNFDPQIISAERVVELIKNGAVKYYQRLIDARKRRTRIMYTFQGFLNEYIYTYFEYENKRNNKPISDSNQPIKIESAKMTVKESKTDVATPQ